MASKRLALAHFRSIAAALTAMLAVGARPDSASAVVYTNVTGTIASGFSGINHVQHPGNATGSGLLRTGGAAAGDFNNDGWVDLFVTRLNNRPLLYRNNGGDGTFTDVAFAAGFTVALPANGPAWGDIDNDGDKDLYVTSSGGTRFYMYVNDGNGNFTEQAVQRGADVSDVGGVSNVFRYGQSVTFGDYDGDGYLDIHTNDWGNDISVSTSRLLHNLGAANPGYFEDVTAAAGLDVYRASPFYPGATSAYRHSSTFTDIDRDGHPDLVIASDFKTSQLFWNNGDGTFTDGTITAGVGSDEDGMGSTIGDFDGDGRLDWFITALVDIPGQTEDHSGNRLYRNNGDRTFADQTDLGGVRDSGWSWGTTFLDHDNDRDLDLFVTNGWNPGLPFPDQSHIYQNDNGVFTDISAAAGVTDTGQGRGLLSLDYDNDGDLDVFIVNHGAKPILYRNDGGNANDWLKIKVEGTASNRDGIGAFITVDPDANVVGDEIVREINAGSNFLSQNELTAHFGLGPNSGTIDLISVVWPSGAAQVLSNVSANQVLSLVENVMSGDYNGDGKVDAADYVVWRKTGINGQQGYDNWRANFGMMAMGSGSGIGSSAAVPEPPGLAMTTLALGLLLLLCSGKAKPQPARM
ncbi:MAG: CRTAC1 family protein [Planctomycetes bacterium]|nr:CRTAC1 family protein [Planctomycetota bacterium]